MIRYWRIATHLVFPGTASVYFVAGMPEASAVTGTFALFTLLGGVLIEWYDRVVFDGRAIVEVDPGGMTSVSLEIEENPEIALETQDELRFQIVRVGSTE